MEIIRKIKDLKIDQTKTIGYVPTMGALHEGHKSLIKKARKENDLVIVTVFVNPLQFGPDEDYENYPRDLEADAKICEELGADIVFSPKAEEFYPEDFSMRVVPSEKMTNILCGITRPTHFTGVCTVLLKFFNLIKPNRVYMGKKDIQQLAIVKRMVTDFNLDIEIIGCPIVREEDGLAKSSRNTYLNPEEKQSALALSQALKLAKEKIDKGEMDVELLKEEMKKKIDSYKYTKIDYLEILNFENFDRIEKIGENTLIAMAVYVGKTRLIDNLVI